VDHSPKNITTLLSLGGAYVDADRHQEAQSVFQTVSALDPDSQDLKDARGKLAFKEGDVPLAAQLLAETQNGDAIARYFNNLAIALAHGGKFDKAIETYENAIKLLVTKARLSSLHYNLGLACAKKGDLARAFRELATSYKGDPTFEKAYVALARVSKQMKEAGQTYDAALAREVTALRRSAKDATGDGDAAAKGERNSAA
jgi:tetratricopeptide (TPR) repeat protein